MNIVEFQKDIKSNALKNVYIISGEEIGLINFYINQIKAPIKREESVKSVWSRLTNKGIIQNHDVYVIRDDKDFTSSKARWKQLSEIKYGTLILLVTKFEKKNEFYKENVEHWVEFEKMTAKQLERYFLKQYSFSAKQVEYVIALCENDFTRIDNELDKLSRTTLLGGAAFEDAADVLIHTEDSVDIFKVVNNIIGYRIEAALLQVEVMLANNESMIGLLTLVYNNFVNAAKILGTKNPTEEALGIKKFQITTIKNNFNYNLDSAFAGILILTDAIEGIKNGKYSEAQAIHIALFKIYSLS